MRIVTILATLLLFSCNRDQKDLSHQSPQDANKQARQIFDQFNIDVISLYPQSMTVNGIHSKDDQLNDLSEAVIQRLLNLSYNSLKKIKSNINPTKLDSINSFALKNLEEINNTYRFLNKYWYHRYSVNPIDGEHLSVTKFLVDKHPLNSKKDVENYIQRVVDTKRKYRSLLKRNQIQFEKGLFVPVYIVKKTIKQLDSILAIKPEQQAIYTNFTTKIALIKEIENKEKVMTDLAFYIKANMLNRLGRWRNFLFNEYQKSAFQTGSVFELPAGEEFYKNLTKLYDSDSVINTFNISDLTKLEILPEIKKIILSYSDKDPSNYYRKLNNANKQRLHLMIPQPEQKLYQTFFSWLHWIDIRLHQNKEPIEQLIKEIGSSKLFKKDEIERLLDIIICYPAYFSQFPTILN